MSFDLYFCREKPTDVTLADLRDWIGKWKYFTEFSSEGYHDFGYRNENTGVYFTIGHEFPSGITRPGPRPDDAGLPAFAEGYYPVSLDFTVNFLRPSFFALEAMPVVVDLAESFGLLIGNPQNGEPGATPVPTISYFSPSADGASGNHDTKDPPGEDAATPMASPNGELMPGFPDVALRPRHYTADQLIDNWRRVNASIVDRELRESASAHGTHRTIASRYAAPETTTAFWRYMREFDGLLERFDEFLVHRILFVKKSRSDRVYTAAMWSGPCQQIFPPVDYFLIPRQLSSFFGLRRNERFFLTEARNVLDLLRPGLESYEPIPGTYLITAETLINSEEGGIMDLAQDFFDTAQFPPEDGDFDIVAVDEFVDTGLLNTD